MGNARHVLGPATTPRDGRLADGALLAVQGPTVLDARTGVLSGPGSTALVTGTGDTAPMAYNVAPHQWATSRRTADGPYLGALDAVRKVPTTAAPPSGSRVDVVWVRQADNDPTVLTPDNVTEDQYGVTQGASSPGTPQKPPLPVGALELATATVAAGATSTNGAGVTITQTARQTAARGGIHLARPSDTDPPAYDGQYRDHPTRGLQRGTGGAWRNVASVPDGEWIAATTSAAWSYLGAPFAPARYRKLSNGQVEVQASLLGASATSVGPNTPPVFTLPVGYRPDATLIIPAVASDAFAEVRVTSAGSVLAQAAASFQFGWLAFAFSFSAA